WRALPVMTTPPAQVREPQALAAPVVSPPAPAPTPTERPSEDASELPAATAQPASTEVSAMPARRRTRRAQPKPEAVIPLVHAPDDPGPEAVQESEPNAE